MYKYDTSEYVVVNFHCTCRRCWFLWLFVCLFVVYRPTRGFSLIWKCHHCRWWAATFYLCSALGAIEQWGFFSVPHVLWHGSSVYNGVCKNIFGQGKKLLLFSFTFRFNIHDTKIHILQKKWLIHKFRVMIHTVMYSE